MSVDETIRELSGTLNQLGVLVNKINEQIGGISGRINITLQNFDDSVAGIAKDASKMTDQVEMTIGQIPGSWAFYLLFCTLIAVLVLLSIFIVINLIVKVQSICRTLRGDSSRASTPLQSLVQAELNQPLHAPITMESTDQQQSGARLREFLYNLAVEMEAEPRRYGIDFHPHHSQHQMAPLPTSRATVASTTVYHPGQMRQMEYWEGGGGGASRQNNEGGSPALSELRGRGVRGSPNSSRAQPV